MRYEVRYAMDANVRMSPETERKAHVAACNTQAQ